MSLLVVQELSFGILRDSFFLKSTGPELSLRSIQIISDKLIAKLVLSGSQFDERLLFKTVAIKLIQTCMNTMVRTIKDFFN